MYVSEEDRNRKKELYKGIEEALNKRSLLSSKITTCTFRSVFEEKVQKQTKKEQQDHAGPYHLPGRLWEKEAGIDSWGGKSGRAL